MVMGKTEAKTAKWDSLTTRFRIDLNKTLFSGQVFQFKHYPPNIFIGNIYNDLAILKQDEDKIWFVNYNATIKQHLIRFFNLEIDSNIHDSSEGLRFLTNELYSTIFSFICSSNNNITRISKMVEYLYKKGTPIPIDFSIFLTKIYLKY